MPKITIIMPSLNVASYIDECIASVINQTLGELEILCVDAGSTDGTVRILEKYAINDSRIRIIYSDKKSYGYQVNRGIQEAKGKYIAILETDDYVEPEMYECLFELAEQTKCDYVKANFRTYYTSASGARVLENVNILDDLNDENNRILHVNDSHELHLKDVNVWSGIYRRDFLIENNIKCNETAGAAFQDIGFLQQIYWKANTAYYTERAFYNYCIDREDSSTNKGNGLQFAYQEYRWLLSDEMMKDVELSRRNSVYERMADVFLENFTKALLLDKERENAEIIEWFLQILLNKEQEHVIHRDYLENIISEGVDWIHNYKQKLQRENVARQNRLEGLKGQSVIIFGAGIRGKFAYRALDSARVVVKGFCDNNVSMWGQKIGDAMIYNPKEIIVLFPNVKYVIANKLHSQEIASQLCELGIDREHITIWE